MQLVDGDADQEYCMAVDGTDVVVAKCVAPGTTASDSAQGGSMQEWSVLLLLSLYLLLKVLGMHATPSPDSAAIEPSVKGVRGCMCTSPCRPSFSPPI